METLQHKFVEYIPDTLVEGTLYISMEHRIAVHRCVCGCGNEVVTPFSPTDWELKFYGDTVSLTPSIGNWSFDCQSHYWIIKNRIKHSGKWSDQEIASGKSRDKQRKDKFYTKDKVSSIGAIEQTQELKPKPKSRRPKSMFSFLKFK